MTAHIGGRVAYDHGAERWVWRCSGCGKQGHWEDSWWWYGSQADADAGSFSWVACSDECKRARRPEFRSPHLKAPMPRLPRASHD